MSYTNLTDLFGDIADSIRSKTGSNELIKADAFPEAIDAIPTGGGDEQFDALVKGTIVNASGSVSYIGNYAFYNCYSLQTANFPNCLSIGASAFASCFSLQTVSFPNCSDIRNYAFAYCSSLQTVSFPNCLDIRSFAFAYCSSLQTVSFPNCSDIVNSAFYNCPSLQTVSFPNCSNIRSGAFMNCFSLQTANFPNCLSIGNSAFRNCYNLVSLYLDRVSSVTKLSNSMAFNSTPIAGYTASTSGVYGSVFVPASLETAFKTSTNWSYFSSRIVGV